MGARSDLLERQNGGKGVWLRLSLKKETCRTPHRHRLSRSTYRELTRLPPVGPIPRQQAGLLRRNLTQSKLPEDVPLGAPWEAAVLLRTALH